MKNEKLIYAIGDIAERYICEAAEDELRAGTGNRTLPLRRAVLLAAAVAAALLLCGAAIYAAAGGDLWWQIPADDPVEVVRQALEQQANKDYTISIEIQRVAVDPDETARARDKYLGGEAARRRGWSDAYLEDHFVAVKAVYRARYDHTQTTRSDGDVAMYFYLAQDVDSGLWSIVDNSGNLNLAQSPEPEPSASTGAGTGASVPPSVREQLRAYLSGLYTQEFSPYYDGLRYEMSRYEEKTENGTYTAGFLWTMYHLGKGWDVGSDEGTELTVNEYLHVTVELRDSGELDLDTILVYTNADPTGGTDYVVLEEYSAPLPRIQWRKQITEYLTGQYEEKYAALCDSGSLNCRLSHYEDTETDGVCTAAFLWHVSYPGGEGPHGPVPEYDRYDIQVSAAAGEDGLLDMRTVSVLREDKLPDPPDVVGPGSPTWQQIQVEAYLTGQYNKTYSPYRDGLRYEMSRYEEKTENGTYTAGFLWTMYYRDRDGGAEQTVNEHLHVTAAIKNSGVLDLDTISIAYF